MFDPCNTNTMHWRSQLYGNILSVSDRHTDQSCKDALSMYLFFEQTLSFKSGNNNVIQNNQSFIYRV